MLKRETITQTFEADRTISVGYNLDDQTPNTGEANIFIGDGSTTEYNDKKEIILSLESAQGLVKLLDQVIHDLRTKEREKT